MRGAAVSIVVVVALAVGAATSGATAASYQAKNGVPQNAAFPTWSPDGKQIAFVYTKHQFSPSARYRIVRTSSKPGGAVHTILATWGECCVQMQWAADGRILIDPASRVKSVRVGGGKPKSKRLFFPECDNSYGCQSAGFILSPDREYAAVANTADDFDPNYPFGIGLVELNPGREPSVVSSQLAAEESTVIDTALAFTPDSRQLVFSRSSWGGPGNDGPPALMAINLSGGGSVPLAQSGIPGASLVPDDAAQLQWSLDAGWVAYVEGFYGHGPQQLEVVPTMGESTPWVVATCGSGSRFHFSWSPTSKLIAYECDAQSGSGETSQFATVSPDGTEATNLLKGRNLVPDPEHWVGEPRWSPDGSRLLFVAQSRHSDIDHVFTVRADGSHLTRIGLARR